MAAAEPFPSQPRLLGTPPRDDRAIARWMRQLSPIRDMLWQQGSARTAHQQLAALQATLPKVMGDDPVAIGANHAYWELVGYACWHRKNYRKAAEAFERADNPFLCGYVHLLEGQLAKAFDALATLPNDGVVTPNLTHWGRILLGLVSGQLQTLPTVLQVRQNLERDVAHLAIAGQQRMINQLCQYAPVLAQVNTETYKFIGRGLLNSGFAPQSESWLLMAHQLNISDPELYYHLGELYVAKQEYASAKRALQQCLMMTDQYPPARYLLAAMAKD